MLQAALTPLLIPLVSFLLLALIGPLRRTGRFAGWISCAAAILSCVAALDLLNRVVTGKIETYSHVVPWLVANGKTIGELGVRIDGISASMLVVVTLVASCVQVYSLGYLKGEPDRDLGRYFTWHSLFVVVMGGLVIAPNLLQAFMCWELVGLCSYLLIGYYWKKPSAGHAAVKAVWVTKFADIGFLTGLVLLYSATGGFSWDAWDPSLTGGVSTAVAGLIFMGVMGKSAQIPLHIWLPNAMEGPTPVSALLHAATMVAAGVFVVVRAYPLFEQAPDVLLVMAWIGGLTAFVAACTAVVQDDIKKVLAYSTCSQLGYMVAALGSGSILGGYFHLTTHAFFKALLFLGAGAAIHVAHSNSIRDMGGLLKKTPWSGAMFIVGALALAGFPGFSGFFSKDLILEQLMENGLYGPFALCLISAGITAFYMTRVVCIAYLGKPSEAVQKGHGAPITMAVPMLALTGLALVAGFGGGTLGELWGGKIEMHLSPVGMAATATGLIGIGYGYVRYGMGKTVGPSLGGLREFILSGPIDGIFDKGWRRGLLPLARGLGFTDRYVVDGLVNLSGHMTLTAAERLRRLQTGRAQDYLVAVVAGVLFFVIYGAVGG
jgi:NADH-quinone oxidoreductase subunit L